MDLAAAAERVWYGDDAAAAAARLALTPLSALFGGIAGARGALYDRGLARALPLALPAISVGNLTVGGTGKTPVAAWIAHRLVERGARPALLMRGVMIGIGAALVSEFSWILLVFGVILIITAVRMLCMGDGHGDPSRNFILRFMRRHFPLTAEFHGEHFFIREPVAAAAVPATPAVSTRGRGRLMMTPLAPALVMVAEATSLVAVNAGRFAAALAVLQLATSPFSCAHRATAVFNEPAADSALATLAFTV